MRLCASEPHLKLLAELSLLHIRRRTSKLLIVLKKIKFIFTSYVFFHVWGLLVKCHDLFHLAPNLAEESLSSRAVPPGFMYNSASALFWQIAAVPKYLFRLQSSCHSKGQPGISPHPPSICPTLFTQTPPCVALFIGLCSSTPTPHPHPLSTLQQPILHYRLANMHTSFSSCHRNNSSLVPSNHVTNYLLR